MQIKTKLPENSYFRSRNCFKLQKKEPCQSCVVLEDVGNYYKSFEYSNILAFLEIELII